MPKLIRPYIVKYHDGTTHEARSMRAARQAIRKRVAGFLIYQDLIHCKHTGHKAEEKCYVVDTSISPPVRHCATILI
jgi:hypothetical protein